MTNTTTLTRAEAEKLLKELQEVLNQKELSNLQIVIYSNEIYVSRLNVTGNE